MPLAHRNFSAVAPFCRRLSTTRQPKSPIPLTGHCCRRNVPVFEILAGKHLQDLACECPHATAHEVSSPPSTLLFLWTEHPLARHICPRTGHPHIARCFTLHAITRGSRANTAQDCALWCLLKDSVIPASSHMLPYLSLNTSKRSLSPTSPIFQPSSPSLSCPSELDQETLRDSRRSGGYTQSASHTGYEPKLIQFDDFEPGRIELDRNLGTDPYQIPE